MIRKEIQTVLKNLEINEEDFIQAVTKLPEPKDSKEPIYLIMFYKPLKNLGATESTKLTDPVIMQARKQYFNWTDHNVLYEDWAIKLGSLTVGRLEVAYDI